MTQIYWTRRQILDGQIERAARAIRLAPASFGAFPALDAWIADPREWTGRAGAALVLETVLALEAARVMNGTALKALHLSPSTVKRWRDAVAAARRRDKALDTAAREAIEAIRAAMHEEAMTEQAKAKQQRRSAQGEGRAS